MLKKIERYIQGTINTNGCNLSCKYCYLKLQGRSAKGTELKYGIEHIKKAMSTERWGICYISLAGDGETLMDRKAVDVTRALLETGHFLNVINNGTMTKNLKYMLNSFSKDQIARTMLTFSLHYNELLHKGLLDTYFENVRMMRDNGFTIYIHLVLADEYIPIADKIKAKCMKEIGMLPQIGIVRDERSQDSERVFTKYTKEAYYNIADSFNSVYFELQKKLYEENCAEEYCYAGELGVLLNFSNGLMRQCVCNSIRKQVFENTDEPIKFERVGNNCASPWCFCSTFQIFGMIAGKNYPTYDDIYSKSGNKFVSEEMKNALSVRLADEYVKRGSVK